MIFWPRKLEYVRAGRLSSDSNELLGLVSYVQIHHPTFLHGAREHERCLHIQSHLLYVLVWKAELPSCPLVSTFFCACISVMSWDLQCSNKNVRGRPISWEEFAITWRMLLVDCSLPASWSLLSFQQEDTWLVYLFRVLGRSISPLLGGRGPAPHPAAYPYVLACQPELVQALVRSHQSRCNSPAWQKTNSGG